MENNRREFKGVWIPAEIWEWKQLSWNEKITDAEIENLKENKIRLDLLDAESPEIARNMRKIPEGLVEWWSIVVGWEKSFSNGSFLLRNITYRLNHDWERPEPEWYDGM